MMNKIETDQLSLAQASMDAGNSQFAQQLLLHLLKNHPDHPRVNELLGYIAGNLGQISQAAQYLACTAKLEPENGPALYYLGYCLQQLGRHVEALPYLHSSLAILGELVENVHTYAVSLSALGQNENAVNYAYRAVEVDGSLPEVHFTLGRILLDLNRPADALIAFNQCLRLTNSTAALLSRAEALRALHQFEQALNDCELALQYDPNNALAWSNRGVILYALKRWDEAILSYAAALKIDGNNANIMSNMGASYFELKQLERAIDCYEKATAIDPNYSQPWLNKAIAYALLQRKDESIAAYQTAKRLGNTAAQIDYALASLGALTAPKIAPPDYVENLFDKYANHFDEHLTQKLGYKTPTLIVELLSTYLSHQKVNIVDIGCGTGLCGPLLRPRASRLIGVDLSTQMLAIARSKNIYDEVVCADAASYLASTPSSCDVIVAADVFVYIGDLTDVFTHAQRALHAGGVFAFSVESHHENDEFLLLPSMRYAHSAQYVAALAKDHQFSIEASHTTVIRFDRELPIHGSLYLLRAL
jgi:predicted TPR repeat methyltransferase